ncbi:MAG TPA: DUF2059 domain-containing protein [Thermoanaerobaculia bacterium]|jgi:hypothetical protein
MRHALAVLALTFAMPLYAQQESKEKLAAELLELLDVGMLTEVALLPHPDAPDERRELLSRMRNELTRQRLLELYAPLFTHDCTVDELQAMVAFYRTEAGRKSARLLTAFGSPAIVEQLVLSGEEARRYAEHIEREKTDPGTITMNVLRSVAVAAESYAVDHNFYPRVSTLEELRQLLEPTYIRELPLVDAWGTPLFYVSDGSNYRFASAGADRRFESATRQLDLKDTEPREMDGDAFDLIFQSGAFIQLPRQEP